MTVRILEGHALDVLGGLPAGSVHAVCTSPPYWQLRDYGTPPQRWPDGWVGEWGQEPEPERYVDHTVAVLRAVRRVLRDDGTLWLNLGDTYWNDPGGQNGAEGRVGAKAREANRQLGRRRRASGTAHAVLKRKDLLGLPWRVALALQADGWYLRAEVIWHKPNALPESVRDRPTKAHEPLFLLAKRPTYYYDAEAIAEPVSGTAHPRGAGLTPAALLEAPALDRAPPNVDRLHRGRQNPSCSSAVTELGDRRNRRSVWSIPLAGYAGAHFATFPPALVEPCVLAGTSAWGCCPACGAPWRRVTERRRIERDELPQGDPRRRPRRYDAGKGALLYGPGHPGQRYVASQTLGWRPGCVCPLREPVPCTVLDPCAGAGTTGLVADRLGRDAVLVELRPEYAAQARHRLTGDAPLFADVLGAGDVEASAGELPR
jgi:DNA modification methylase